MNESPQSFEDELARAYADQLPDLEAAAEQLKDLLKETIGRLPHGRLVRAHLPRPHSRDGTENPRIKSLESLRRKAEANGWDPEEAVRKAADLVGGRVVCNNREDVYRFAEVLEELATPIDGPPIRREDYIADPKDSGYRCLHLYVPIDVGEAMAPRYVTCEVQVRTLLQHAWAVLSHEDIYKFGEGLPDDLRDRVRDLGEFLATADRQASEVRDRVMELREPPAGKPDLDAVTDEGLTYLFGATFGRDPADYEIRAARNMCEGEGLESLEPLEKVIIDDSMRQEIADAYGLEVRWEIDRGQLFELLPLVVSRSLDAAISEAERRGRAEWEALDQRFRNEVLRELPGSFSDFVEELRLGAVHVHLVGEALGGSVDCRRCGSDLIDPELFAEGICEHYGEEDMTPVVDALYGSGVQTTAPLSSGLCDYCAHVLAKND